MTIDIKELRKVIADCYWPTSPVTINSLLDRLEEAEKSDAESIAMYRRARDERDDLRAKIPNLTISIEYLSNLKKSYEELIGELQDERDDLRAKIERMERQEPAYWGPKHAIEGGSTTVIVGKFPVNPTDAPLYYLPGAQGEKDVCMAETNFRPERRPSA